LLLFFFSVKKKRSVTLCETGWLLWRIIQGKTPPPPNGGSPPLSGEAYNCKLANAVFKKLDRLHK
ncbi:hypothetical protein, partial [uncultured Ruminococcus sp.]|uniref:hypothetical protein n=1 Tax=uncultured Ruminococcus sp. TaxID=165186 RepID=UPI0026DD18E4